MKKKNDLQPEEIPHIEIWPPEGFETKGLKAKAEHPPKPSAAFIEALAQLVASQAREVVPPGGETQRTVHTVPRLPWKEDDAPPEPQQTEEPLP